MIGIATSVYAALVLLLTVHHAAKKITPKTSVKLFIGLACVVFSLGLAFIPNLNSTVSAVALIFAVGANIVLQPMYFIEKSQPEATFNEDLSVTKVSVNQ